ncbi:putative lysophosphatidylcholine acyltransferase [Grifola frondosa]|uniref:Tafazzin family protein n=1 Tax=Grifola frondosa TaxID=5627 RepID=A0A1C7M773_GRIFR|nr:putative lysophosphatidylcholine acyltransferase [Grifola frondosa]
MATLLSKATVGTIGLVCKAVLNLGYCSSVTVNGIENLFEALESEERDKGRGVITIANHISTLDEPLIWGTSCSQTHSVLSTFFRNGRVLETFRGHGIFQPAIDTAIKNLNEGAWIHLFCEGKVQMGCGRMLMEAVKPPVIIPMWLTGFDKLMPEAAHFPITSSLGLA